MSPARPAHRSVAVGAALIVTIFGTQSAVAPARAVGPQADTSQLRANRSAWDQPSLDDPSRLIVTFRPGTTAVARLTAIGLAGADRLGELPGTRAVTVHARPGRSAAAMTALKADPHVLRVSVDHRRYRDVDPTSEQLWHELWGLDNTGQDIYQGEIGTGGTPDADIDGRQAIGITPGDPSVVVAVIDDGVDFSHPDLAARAWSNPGESGLGKETNGIDDDANGYIDDVHGWDFCHGDNTVHDFDKDFHGTHVAGTIAASLDGAGVVGVAPSVSIMALKFLGEVGEDCGRDSQAIAAIAYAKSFGVHISNNSWGGRGRPDSAPELYDAIATSGMLFVAAAGNDGADNDLAYAPGSTQTTSLPGSWDLPNIVSVAAVDNDGYLASFSNYGATTVDIAAPGVGILSTLPADAVYPVGWGWLSGTSMATPHVSGTAALIASMWPSLAGDPSALKAHLLGSGKPSPTTAGLTVTGRMVDAYRALDTVGPVAKAPTSFGFVVGTTMSPSALATRVAWPVATDDRSGVAVYGLETRVEAGPWSTAVGSTAAGSALRTLTFSTAYGLRVRARDGAGNWGEWSGPATITPLRYQESNAAVRYGGSWARLRTTSASGGQTRYATKPGASATFRFSGRVFALIAPKGPTRGSAKLYIDGAYVSTISLYRSSSLPRIVVAARSWSASSPHTVKLVLVGTAHHPRFDIDAFAILR